MKAIFARSTFTWVVLIGASLPGCSLAIDANRPQCTTNNDCAARGPDFAGTVCIASICQAAQSSEGGVDASSGPDPNDPLWGCMAKPRVASTAPGPFHVSFHLTNIIDPSPPVGVSAVLCRKLDVNCDSPLGLPAVSDGMGNLAFDIDRGFSGYVLFKRDDITPGLYFFNPAVDKDIDALPVQIVTPGIVAALTSSLNSPQRTDRGLILLSAFDCQSVGAADISFVADGVPLTPPPVTDGGTSRELAFYSVGGLPAAMATATDSAGYGGFINVPAGTIAVKGMIGDTRRELQTVSLIVRSASITYSRLVPLGR